MTKQAPLDFKKVEALRKHMLMSITDIASVLNVSRMTYHQWIKGNPIRKSNDTRVRLTLKKLLLIMNEKHWPEPDIIALDPPDRKKKLMEYLSEYH